MGSPDGSSDDQSSAEPDRDAGGAGSAGAAGVAETDDGLNRRMKKRARQLKSRMRKADVADDVIAARTNDRERMLLGLERQAQEALNRRAAAAAPVVIAAMPASASTCPTRSITQ